MYPEQVVLLSAEGVPTQGWHDADLFDQLILLGAPAYRDHDGLVYFDLTLGDDDSMQANTNDPHDLEAAQITLPLDRESCEAVRQWLRER